MSPRRERLMVPEADFHSYYDRPVIKPPVWKVPDVPAYLYLGGMAGVSASLAALGEVTGRPSLRRVGRLAGAAGAAASVVALIHDLGRPARFLHMLRVLKPTSPLSVGSWILAPFGTLSGAAAVSELTGIAPRLGSLAGAGAGVIGPAMTTYTAVLLADTAVPAWHEGHRHLPFVFAGSAMASGGGVGLLAGRDSGPARRVAVTGAALELAATARLEHSIGLPGEAYRTGRAGRLLRVARALTAVGGAAALLGDRSRAVSALAGLCLNAGALTTRFGIFEAGMISARDPKYTVVPQRERLAARDAGVPDRAPHAPSVAADRARPSPEASSLRTLGS